MIPIHELAHAYTTKYYGRRVHCFGFGWFWVAPFAFCDTSDMWLCPPRQRVIVDLIGLYVNVLIAGVAGILMWVFQVNASLVIFFGLFALWNYLFVISNLYPGIELDGYYALMDVFDKPNLRLSAIEWVVESLKKKDFQNTLKNELKRHLPELTYWLSSIFYILFIETIVSYLVLHYLLYGLFSYQNPYVNLTITLFAVSLSSLKMYGEIMKKKKSEDRIAIKI